MRLPHQSSPVNRGHVVARHFDSTSGLWISDKGNCYRGTKNNGECTGDVLANDVTRSDCCDYLGGGCWRSDAYDC